jgi:CheY-like chemotaxis protein
MFKILVADDSRFQIALLTQGLQENGFEVVVAQDACQAGMVARRTAPDAIVLDINMPGGSGIEVLRRLRRSLKTQSIPVVVVSGTSDSEVRNDAMKLGVTDFLAKPVDLNQLCRVLSGLLDNAKAPAQELPGRLPVGLGQTSGSTIAIQVHKGE